MDIFSPNVSAEILEISPLADSADMEQQVIFDDLAMDPILEPVVEPEPTPVVEPEPTPVVEPEPTPVVEPELIPEPTPVVEPEPILESTPVVEPEPILESTPVVEPEPILESIPVVEPEPTPVVEPEPTPVVEQKPVAEPIPEPPPVVEPEPIQTPNAIKPIPKLIFIVPYRDREQHLHFFSKQMADVLSVYPKDAVRILYVHQCDIRSFNRGAMKNIGFLTVKQEYPNDYHNITLVFNDVDTMPFTKGFLSYETAHGRIKHFYGYNFALGGIVSITGRDFEKLGGFPNLWTWGYEDNLLNYRALIHKEISIDRSQFFPIRDKNILHLGDGVERTVNRKEFDHYIQETPEGFHTITQLNTLLEPRPNVHGLNEDFVQVLNFQTGRDEDTAAQKTHNILTGSKPFGDVKKTTPVPVLHRRGSARMSLVMR